MKVAMSAETYQVGAHFKALIKAILVAPLKSFESFFAFQVPLPDCALFPSYLAVVIPASETVITDIPNCLHVNDITH